MSFTVSEILDFVNDNDIKFIRLAFCDIFGTQKNIAILSEQLPQAFEEGVKIETISEDSLFYETNQDIYLFPEPNTFSILPWRPSHGRVVRLFCSMRHEDGSPYEGDSRYLLRKAQQKARDLGFGVRIGCECEFYLFQLDDTGNPTLVPHDSAGYCDISPLDKGENVRREICLAMENMGITPRSSHHERGPGQNEIAFHRVNALAAADGLMSFRLAAKVIAAQNGLYASFMPKPLADKNGSSVHLNLSLHKDGSNLFEDHSQYRAETESFLAGILNKMRDMTLFFHPITNSYTRIGLDIPRSISWAPGNSGRLLRLPAFDRRQNGLELRSPDPSCNPYLAFTLLVEAGLSGIQNRLPLVWDFAGDESSLLPGDLLQSVRNAKNSRFVQEVLPESMLEKYCIHKEEEYHLWQLADKKNEFDIEKYFTKM